MTPWLTASRSFFSALVVAGIGLAMTGCTQDQHKFRSSQYEPKTVRIIETSTEDVLWAMDIPVGHDLLLSFIDEGTDHSVFHPYAEGNPDYAEYKLKIWENGRSNDVVEEGRIELTGNHVTMEFDIRPAPEFYKPYEPAASTDDALPTPEADEELVDAVEAEPEAATAKPAPATY